MGLLEPSTSSTHCSSIKTFLAIDSLTLPFILSSFRQAFTLTVGSFGIALSSSLSLSSLRPSIRQDSNPGLSVFRSGSCSSAGGQQDCAPFGPLLSSTSFSAPHCRWTMTTGGRSSGSWPGTFLMSNFWSLQFSPNFGCSASSWSIQPLSRI